MLDTLLVLTRNNSIYKEKTSNIVSKMVIINDSRSISLDVLSESLYVVGIKELNIFCIDNHLDNKDVNFIETKNHCKIKYAELNTEVFKNYLNADNIFLDNNKNSLYIIRGGNYLDIKNLFAVIENCPTNLGRGGSQKSHMLSPLDLRLSFYLMAMFNFNYKVVNNLNTFNYIGKERYLSWKDNSLNFRSIFKPTSLNMEFKAILVNKMPSYCSSFGKYHLECPSKTICIDFN